MNNQQQARHAAGNAIGGKKIGGQYAATQREEIIIDDETPYGFSPVETSGYGGNSGYVGGQRSVRSADAINNGRVPKSHIRAENLRAVGITAPLSLVKWLMDKGHVTTDEWHHSGKYFNETEHWDMDKLREQIEKLDLEALNNERKQDSGTPQGYEATISFTEWVSKTRGSRPKPVKHADVPCVVRGNWAYLADGKRKDVRSLNVTVKRKTQQNPK